MVPIPEGDVREGGRWSTGQRLKNDALYVGVRAALVLGRLPRAWLARLGSALGAGVFYLAPSLRRIAVEQLERAFPGSDSHALARANFGALGRGLGEALAMTARRTIDPLPLSAEGRATLAAALAEGRGVVLASAHLGPFERVAQALALATPLTVVARESYDPRLMVLYDRLRPYETIYRGAPGAGVRMLRTLRGGRVLGIPMDLRTRAPSVAAPFLGDPEAPTAIGPARLALRTGAAVLVATAAPAPGFDLQISVTRLTVQGLDVGPAGEAELTRRINAELGARIAALPSLWPWLHRRGALHGGSTTRTNPHMQPIRVSKVG